MIELHNIAKFYRVGTGRLCALQNINLRVASGELLALIGPSGSGKSTLLNILGCLDAPDEGAYHLAGERVSALDDDELATVRNEAIGFVFQSFFLLPRLTAWANVAIPLIYRGCSPEFQRIAALEALARVGLSDRAEHRPNELSGGQRQRVAIARALVTDPEVVLADEPTGNLDSRTSLELLDLLSGLHADGVTIIIVTHDPVVAQRCPRVVRLSDGCITQDTRRPSTVLSSDELVMP